ncbi:MAG: helix-turn-helix domain-containing protein [Planctomycetia bacterium]|nr:helix-turn-helix domain-containing protein [Planctomycetia bacterium]
MNQPEPPGKNPWYTAEDVRRLFGGISDRTLARWVQEGRLPPPAKIGAKWKRWPREVIDRMVRDLGGNPD